MPTALRVFGARKAKAPTTTSATDRIPISQTPMATGLIGASPRKVQNVNVIPAKSLSCRPTCSP